MLCSRRTLFWDSIYSNRSVALAASLVCSRSLLICFLPAIWLLTSCSIVSAVVSAIWDSVFSTTDFILSYIRALLCFSNICIASSCALLGHDDILYMNLLFGSLRKVLPWLIMIPDCFGDWFSSREPGRWSIMWTIEPLRLWDGLCNRLMLWIILYGSGTAKKSTFW